MVAPGILEARYRRLAGDEDRRRELYYARTKLGFTIPEWLALPWWHRRLYLEQMNEEAEAQAAATSRQGAGSSGLDPYDAILNGTMDDVQRAMG